VQSLGEENVAMLKVSFFWASLWGYNVVAIDKEYKYVLVAGGSLNYLWILSREKSIPLEVTLRPLENSRRYWL
jgi:apolipoprotein D and lipocalin family protein